MSKRKTIGRDEPVFDGEWVYNYNTTTYWSPTDMISNSPWFCHYPFYEDSFDVVSGSNRVKIY